MSGGSRVRDGVLRLGTRGSALALAQSRQMAARIREKNPGLEIEEVIIRTRGDEILDAALHEVGGKGLFFSNRRSEERRVGKECRSRWSPYH